MEPLNVRRVNFCPEADTRLKMLKGRTGVTPNLLCRVGFCMSLEEPSIPQEEHYPPGPREINRYTLMGEYDDILVALLRQRLAEDRLLWDGRASEQFAALMNRGVLLLAARVHALSDMAPRPDVP